MQSWRNQFQDALVGHFQALRQKNPELSVRAFAKRARLSSGGMAQFLKGNQKWKLSPERALHILKNLGVEESVQRYFAAITHQQIAMPWKDLANDHYALLKDWSFFPILHFFDLNPQPSSEEIAEKLNLDVKHVKAAIGFLLEIGALKQDAAGSITRDPSPLKTSDGPPNETIKEFHKENLNVALKALDRIPAARRDFTALTIAGDRARIDAVKEEIRALLDRVHAIMESAPETNEVFRLSVSFFPMDFADKELGQ
jgi:hypothetical protein